MSRVTIDPPRMRVVRSAYQPPFVFQSVYVDRHYVPGRALVCSILLHSTIISGLFVLSMTGAFSVPPPPRMRVTMIDLKDPNYRLYLPVIGGAAPEIITPKEPMKDQGARSPQRTQQTISKKIIYPGPQPIFSEFPNPTNNIQTILQPSLKNPPILKPPLLLPNIVQLPEPLPPVEPVKPAVRLVEAPSAAVLPSNPLSRVTLPAIAAADPLLAEPRPPQVAKVENVLPEPAKPAQEFLTLSPMPTPRPDTLRLLEGEARGRFAVLPDANSGTAGTDSGRPAAPGNDGAKAAKDDQAQTAADANKREGAPSGVTAGTASSGTGRGKDAFPGITILESGNANPIVTTTGRPAPLQTSYGITILSTEASGGGLPHVGVFSDEQIYTVYVDMRRTVTDPAPSWTFEYGVPKNTQASPHSAKTITRMQQGLVLPFPVVKEQPAFPADLVRKYLKRRIIVFAMINADGKFEKISVKESPDPLLNEAVISALTKWSFRPAQADGEVVPVKALIGIPLVLIP